MAGPPARRRPSAMATRALALQTHRLLAGATLAALFALLVAAAAFTSPGPLTGWGLGGQAAPPKSSWAARRATQTLERTTQASEWRLKVGHAIDVLRTDVSLFDRARHVPDFSIFSEDVVVVDARLPSFRLRGLANYQRVLSTLKWSVRAACDDSRMEITSLRPPVNGEMHMRWRLQLWPKDVLAFARHFMTPSLTEGSPLVVEGYMRYEFDPWSAEIVQHTIDITNPPMFIADLLGERAGSFAWTPPVGAGVGLPSAMTSRVSAWSPSLPQSCEDDFECNEGRANFPLQCCELPLLGNFCCEPGEPAPQQQRPAYVPLPVPLD
mmetsp:Transcript_62343/g.201014  ORF Transcript_62343/g.201014 Transcript_62343/m.201014 type:complete len:324 (-) Transcript_62343:762-1733(-)